MRAALVLLAACHAAAPSGVVLVDAPPGVTDVAALVRQTALDTDAHHRRLVVYVGASWCELCQQIHAAAAAHQLDGDFPTLTLLQFDLDRDGKALEQAGYTSELIPLFALPMADGRASARRESGGVKVGDNVKLLTAKLHRLLDTP